MTKKIKNQENKELQQKLLAILIFNDSKEEEKLMEEEGLQQTANGLISIARPIPMDEENLWDTLDKLYEAAYSETDSMKEWVKELVPTYTIDKRESAAVGFMKAVSENTPQGKAE